MNLMGLFRSPQNELEKGGKQLKNPQEEQHEITKIGRASCRERV